MTQTPPQSAPRNPENMHSTHIEIITPDPENLRGFLKKQFGWGFESTQMPVGTYHIFRTPDGNGGGVVAPMPGQPIGVAPYINVRDIEVTLRSCEKDGAQILVPVTEVPGVGRFFWFTFAGGPPLACWQPLGM